MSRHAVMPRLILGLLACVILLLASLRTDRPTIASAQGLVWSTPQRIPGQDDDVWPPYLVADENRTVHAFNNQNIVGERLIIYSQWTLEGGWTTPVDILLSPRAHRATIQGAFLDRRGMMHVIFFGGNNLGADIYYSRAWVEEVDSARSWSSPVMVGEEAVSPDCAALAGDDMGNLFLVYSGGREGLGLYEAHSRDGGETWSQPVAMFLTQSDALWPYALRMDIDGEGRLHAVWNVVGIAGSGEAVYYAGLETDRLVWSTPVMLAQRDEGDVEVDWPSIISHQGELFVVYQDGPTQPTRWFRRSSDGGETWSDPVRPFEHVGSYGHAVLLKDSAGVLHMVLGNRIGQPPATHGLWHSVWYAGRWSELQAIVSGPASKSPETAFDPSRPQAVISQGNVLLATWHNDPGLNGVWYSYTVLDAPELPAVGYPRIPETAAPTAVSTATPVPATMTPSPERVSLRDVGDQSSRSVTGSPTSALLAGVAPVILLVLAVLGVHSMRRHR